MPRAVVTGGTGMVGRHLADDLVMHGYEVVLLVRGDSPRLSILKPKRGVTVVACALNELSVMAGTDSSSWPSALRNGADVFFHLAWSGVFGRLRDDCDTQVANIVTSLAAVDMAKALECSVFVGVGSQAEYGRLSGVVHPDSPAHPETAYGSAKLATGQLTRIACSQASIKHVWARVFSVYGPWDSPGTMVSTVCTALLKGEVPRLTSCDQDWDYLYASDAAKALRLLAERGRDGSVYCVGSGISRPLREYVEIIRDHINPDLSLGFGDIPYASNQVMHLRADIANLESDTGFSPDVRFEQGVELTIDWLKSTRFNVSPL